MGLAACIDICLGCLGCWSCFSNWCASVCAGVKEAIRHCMPGSCNQFGKGRMAMHHACDHPRQRWCPTGSSTDVAWMHAAREQASLRHSDMRRWCAASYLRSWSCQCKFLLLRRSGRVWGQVSCVPLPSLTHAYGRSLSFFPVAAYTCHTVHPLDIEGVPAARPDALNGRLQQPVTKSIGAQQNTTVIHSRYSALEGRSGSPLVRGACPAMRSPAAR